MERKKPYERMVINEHLNHLRGVIIETWPEFKHITIFYQVNVARLKDQECTVCKREKPIMIRYEMDHLTNVYYDAMCERCSPNRIVEKMRSGNA